MDYKKFSIKQCEKAEEKLTKQAVDYANLFRNPERKAQAAKDIISGIPDKNIRLTYEQQKSSQPTSAKKEISAQYAGAKDLVVLKATIYCLRKENESLDNKVKVYSKNTRELQDNLETCWQELSTECYTLDKKLSNCERKLGYLLFEQSKKTARTLLLALALSLPSLYVCYELAKQPNTCINQVYHAVKNLLK